MVSVMALIVASQDLSIELIPGLATGGRSIAKCKGMRRGAQAHDGDPSVKGGLKRFELFGREGSPSHKDQEHVGGFKFLMSEKLSGCIGTFEEKGSAKCRCEFCIDELGKRFVSSIFIFTDEDDEVRAMITGIPELGITEDLVTRDGRAHELLDVFDDAIGASEVRDVGPALGVVHGVRQIANEDNVAAVASHLPQAKGTSQYTHVRVDSDEHDLLDLMLFEQVPDFDAAIGNGITISVNLDAVDLLEPGDFRIATLRGELFVPACMFFEIVIFSAIGLIEGIDAGFFLGDAIAPL